MSDYTGGSNAGLKSQRVKTFLWNLCVFSERIERDVSIMVIYTIPKQIVDYSFEVSAPKKCDSKNFSY